MEEKSDWRIEIAKVKQCGQRQDSTMEQLRDLYRIANLLGFYDAADFIREKLSQ